MCNNKYLILFVDEHCQNRFMYCDDKKYIENNNFNTAAFVNDHPELMINDWHIIGVYDSDTDLLRAAKNEKASFFNNCGVYGFAFDDYLRPIYNPNTQRRGLFIGFLPQNRKYKALIRDEITGRLTKASLAYVRKYMI